MQSEKNEEIQLRMGKWTQCYWPAHTIKYEAIIAVLLMSVITLENNFYFSPAQFHNRDYLAIPPIRFLLDVQANYKSYCI